MVSTAFLALVTILASVLYTSFTRTTPYDVQTANMNANLQHKYDAKLAFSTTRYSDEYLTQTNEYELSFSNGTKGTYNIKWDKTTSEPTIIEKDEPPTAHELNQNANKK